VAIEGKERLLMDTVQSGAIARGRSLEYVTIAWNSMEAVVAVVAGLLAGSIALVGFGFDSVIEVSSGAILLWRLFGDNGSAHSERKEKLALKLVGYSFMALAAYVAFDALRALIRHTLPETTYPGIILAALSLAVMPSLARAKRKVAAAIQSRALVADSRQTDICAYLSGILLVGLLLNATLGWWWADPVAGLAMVPIIVKESREALRGERCCDNCH
jgi:divalent metal cation (Fe/Co/Zn/Cd) transporter